MLPPPGMLGGAPIGRPYMGGAPSVKMIAHHEDYNEDFRVGLWKEGKGFIVHLDHEYDYVLDSERREVLVPSISRYEQDRFLDPYHPLFGPLDQSKFKTKGTVVRNRGFKNSSRLLVLRSCIPCEFLLS